MNGLQLVDESKINEIEPYVRGVKGLWSPNTGIVDYIKLTEAYAKIFQSKDGQIYKSTKLLNILSGTTNLILETNKGDFSAKYLINCAGLHADRIAQMMKLDTDVRIVPFRGEYFTLTDDAKKMVNGLIYPVPDPDLPFLGVHFTKRINNEVVAGPNAVMAYSREG